MTEWDLVDVPAAAVVARLRREGRSGKILFELGNARVTIELRIGSVAATSSSEERFRLGGWLVGRRILDEKRLLETVSCLKKGESLDRGIDRLGILSKDGVRDERRRLAAATLADLFGWEVGRAKFEEAESEVESTRHLRSDSGSLLFEAARSIERSGILARVVPLVAEHFRKSVEYSERRPLPLTAEERALWERWPDHFPATYLPPGVERDLHRKLVLALFFAGWLGASRSDAPPPGSPPVTRDTSKFRRLGLPADPAPPGSRSG